MGMVMFCLFGSAQNPAWTLPGNYIHYLSGSSFAVPGLPSPALNCYNNAPNQPGSAWDGYDGQLAEYSSNMMLDRDGKVKFFIVDGIVYDGEGNYINELYADQLLATGASETVIVPDPANCDRYYIITVRLDPGQFDKLPYVFLLDMSLPNETVCSDCDHFGALVLQSCPNSSMQRYDLPVSCVESSTIPPDPSPGKVSNCFIAASDLQQGSFRWVFISNPNGIFRFRIDANGFNYDNHFIPFGVTGYNQYRVRAEMELVDLPDGGFRIAVPYESDPFFLGNNVWEYLFVVDLDAGGNAIPSTEKRFPMYIYNPGGMNRSAAIKGIEFSQNGDRIYVTHSTAPQNPDQMEYYDFSNPVVALVPFSIPSSIDVQFSMLELTSNDKLILANQNGLYQLPNATSATPAMLTQMWAFNYAPTWEGSPGYDFHKMYMLPDQIDGMDYSAYFVANLACCINSSVFEADRYCAASGTWQPGSNPLVSGSSSNIYIKEELRIPADANVTINNMTLHFAPGARLVIENGTGGQQGGILTLNNTKLTVDERCSNEELWLGVEVWGNTADLQGSLGNSSQGRLFLQNASLIEHAWIGVLVGKRIATEISQGDCPPLITVQPFSFDQARDGGIVRSTGSSFFGNQRGVWFQPYLASNGANNLSQFSTTDFSWDGPLRGAYSLQNHAYLNQVKGIFFKGCSFRNVTPSAFTYTQLGTGIYSFKAQFYVQPYCPVLVPQCTVCPNEVRSSFENLRFGVRTYNTGSLTFNVNRSDFDNCEYGIYAYQTRDSRIANNTFAVRQESYQTAGIAMYRTPTFTIEENDILGIGNPANTNSFGIVINNSGTADNDIYLNRISNLHIGGQSELENAVEITSTNQPGGSFNMSGLNWTCNDFDSGIELADLTVVNGRIDYFQGHAIGHSSLTEATLGSARNKFSLHGEAPSLEHDIMVAGSAIQELQYVGLNTPYYWADSYTSNWVLPLFSSFNGTLAEATGNMCPSRCEGDKEIKQQMRTSMQSEIENLESQLSGASRLTQEEIDGLESRLRQVKEQLNILENGMVADALLDYESLADLESNLNGLGEADLFEALEQTFAADMSRAEAPVAIEEPVEFLPIEPGNQPEKMAGLSRNAFEFRAYPNPVGPGQTEVQISWTPSDFEQVEVRLMDMMGRTVFSKTMYTNTTGTLDLKGLGAGVYNLLIHHDGQLLGSSKVDILR